MATINRSPTLAFLDNRYVQVLGDTMTGALGFGNNVNLTMGDSGATDYYQTFDGTNAQFYTSGDFVFNNGQILAGGVTSLGVGAIEVKPLTGTTGSPIIVRESDGSGGMSLNAGSAYSGFGLGVYWDGATWRVLTAGLMLVYKSPTEGVTYSGGGLTPGDAWAASAATVRSRLNLADGSFAHGAAAQERFFDINKNDAGGTINRTGVPSLRVLNKSTATHSFSIFEVAGNNGATNFMVGTDGLGSGAITGERSSYVGMTTNHPMWFMTNYTKRVRLASGGDLGLSSDNQKLTMGAAFDTDYYQTFDGTNAEFYTSGSFEFFTGQLTLQRPSASHTIFRIAKGVGGGTEIYPGFYLTNDDAAPTSSGNSAFGMLAKENHSELVQFVADNAGNQVVFTNIANRNLNHDHAAQTNPTVFIHSDTSPDTANDEWISFTHDKTDGVIGVGSGDIKIGDDNTNYASFAADGELTLHGTARVNKEFSLNLTDFNPGASGPTTALHDIFTTYEFTIDDDMHTSFEMPDDWATGTDITVEVYWAIDEAYVTNSGEVQWSADWRAVAVGEVISGGASGNLDFDDVNIPATANTVVKTEATLSGASLAADDLIAFKGARIDVDDGNDPTAEPYIIAVRLEYIADKLGEGL